MLVRNLVVFNGSYDQVGAVKVTYDQVGVVRTQCGSRKGGTPLTNLNQFGIGLHAVGGETSCPPFV